jgi:hypothetical protein
VKAAIIDLVCLRIIPFGLRTANTRDELITKITREIGLDCMGDDAEDEEEVEHANDGGDDATPPAPAPLLPHLRRL